MPKRRARAGRPRKPGHRTNSGRLSRAAADVHDRGTHESQAKRAYMINGADPQLAATVSGILWPTT
jgi:hypothetical protein